MKSINKIFMAFLYTALIIAIVFTGWSVANFIKDTKDLSEEVESYREEQIQLMASELEVKEEEILVERSLGKEPIFYTPKGNFKAKFKENKSGEYVLISTYEINK